MRAMPLVDGIELREFRHKIVGKEVAGHGDLGEVLKGNLNIFADAIFAAAHNAFY